MLGILEKKPDVGKKYKRNCKNRSTQEHTLVPTVPLSLCYQEENDPAGGKTAVGEPTISEDGKFTTGQHNAGTFTDAKRGFWVAHRVSKAHYGIKAGFSLPTLI